jgi:hypothetical protein
MEEGKIAGSSLPIKNLLILDGAKPWLGRNKLFSAGKASLIFPAMCFRTKNHLILLKVLFA